MIKVSAFRFNSCFSFHSQFNLFLETLFAPLNFNLHKEDLKWCEMVNIVYNRPYWLTGIWPDVISEYPANKVIAHHGINVFKMYKKELNTDTEMLGNMNEN